jgi:drug/metabolite transporter (DMT)-like permease
MTKSAMPDGEALAGITVRERQENVAAGIVWMLFTMMWFVALDSVAKQLLNAAGMPLVQVVWGRFFFHAIIGIAAIAVVWRGRFASKVPRLQLIRSSLLFLTTALFNAGLMTVPLATATAIMFLAPIMLTTLSVPFLGEHVGPRRWSGVAAGFVGAMIIIRPGMEGFDHGGMFLLAAALTNSVYQLITRRVAAHDHPQTTFLHTALAGALLSSVAVPFVWQPPVLSGWVLLVAMGVLGGVGHLFLIFAFDKAPAAAIAPFAYSALIWASIAGYVFFSELPDFWTIVGALVITASGLYIFHRERVVQHRSQG